MKSFGMLMPGRHGYASQGGWATGESENSLPGSLTVDGRSNNDPAEYKATIGIDFIPGFESAMGDVFEAYITEGGSSGGTGSGVDGSDGGYRYGFNGKENDNEVKGEGNQQDYGMRIYDPRLGKFLSVDPLTKEYPWYSPYQFSGSTPIQATDLDGLEENHYTLTFNKENKPELKQTKTVTEKTFLFFWSYTPIETKVITYNGEKFEFTKGGYSTSPISDPGANSFENLDAWLSGGYTERQFGQAFYSTYATNLLDAGGFAEGVATDVAVGKSWAKANSNSPAAKTNKQVTNANNGNASAISPPSVQIITFQGECVRKPCALDLWHSPFYESEYYKKLYLLVYMKCLAMTY